MTKNKTIVFVVANLAKVGGKERILFTIADGLLNRCCNVIIVTSTAGSIAAPAHVKVVQFGDYASPDIHHCERLKIFLKSLRSYSLLLTQIDPSIVIALDLWSLWLSVLSQKFVAIRFKKYIWFHSSLSSVFAKSKLWLANKLILQHNTDGLIVLCESMKEEAIALLGRRIAPKIHVIYNCINTDPNNLPVIYNGSTNRFVYIGRLDNVPKRLDRLIKSFAQISNDFYLDIIGEGPDREMLQELSRKYGIENKIHFIGHQSNPYEYINKTGGASALVLSSDYEGLPMVLIEATGHGLPCIAMDCPTGPRDIVINDLNGLLVPFSSRNEKENINKLTEAMGKICEKQIIFDNTKIKASMDKFTPTKVLKSWVKLIETQEE